MTITTAILKNLEVTGKRYLVKDDKGLYLEVMTSGSKIWRFRYWVEKKEYKLSLGSYPEISLTEARKKRDELRGELAKGLNPAEKKKEEKAVSDGKYHFETIARDWVQKFATTRSQGHSELTWDGNRYPKLQYSNKMYQ